MSHHGDGRSGNIGIDFKLWRAFARRGNEQSGHPASKREANDKNGKGPGLTPACREACGNRAQKNGDKGRAFDQRIGRWQLLASQMVRQNAVLDRSEQRRKNPECEQRNKEDWQRRSRISEHGKRGDEYLGELQPLSNLRLVITIRQLAAECGQKEERRDEDRARKRDQRFRVGPVRLEQDDEDQRGLEKIVVECREELAPEQRGKPPRQKQGRWHATSLLQSSLRTAPGKNQAAFWPPD